MSYSAYTPFRINSNKCSECPEKEIITDKNGNNLTGNCNVNNFLKTKKSKCAFALKFGLYNRRNPFRRYTGYVDYNKDKRDYSADSSICSSNYDENLDEIPTLTQQSTQKQCNSKTAINKPNINPFGRFESSPYGSGSRIVNRF